MVNLHRRHDDLYLMYHPREHTSGEQHEFVHAPRIKLVFPPSARRVLFFSVGLFYGANHAAHHYDVLTSSMTGLGTPMASTSGSHLSPYDVFGGDSPLTVPSESPSKDISPMTSQQTRPFTSPVTAQRHRPSSSPELQRSSNLDRIRARARQQAEDDARREIIDLTSMHISMPSQFPTSTQISINLADDSDDDDSVLDMSMDQLLDSKRKERHATSSPVPSHGSSVMSVDEISYEPGQKNESDSSNEDGWQRSSMPSNQLVSLAAGRSRRAAARTQPYSYKLKLQRPSNSRRKMMEAGHSAAVKMGIIKPSEYRTGVKGLLDDNDKEGAVAKVTRELNRDRKRGTDYRSLDATIKQMERIKALLSRDEVKAEQRRKREASEGLSLSQKVQSYLFEGVAEEDEHQARKLDRRGRPLRSNPRRFDSSGEDSSDEDIDGFETIRRTLAAEIDADGGDDRKAALEIIENDRKRAITGSGSSADTHYEERVFWSSEGTETFVRYPRLKMIAEHGSPVLRLQGAVDSTSRRDQQRIISVLRSKSLVEVARNAATDALASWLTEVALLAPLDSVSFASIRTLRSLLKQGEEATMRAAFNTFLDCQIALGVKQEVTNSAMPNDRTGNTAKDGKETVSTRRVLGTRYRRFLYLLQTFAGSCQAATFEAGSILAVLFMLLLALRGDPENGVLQVTCMDLQAKILDELLRRSNGIANDQNLFHTLIRFLQAKSVPTKTYFVNLLPCHTLRARILTRNVATQLFLHSGPMHGDIAQYDIMKIDLTLILKILQSEDEEVNPLHVQNGRKTDYVLFLANIHLLRRCLSELTLQVSSIRDDRHKTSGNDYHKASGRDLALENGHTLLRQAGVDELLRLDSKLGVSPLDADTAIALYRDNKEGVRLKRICERLDNIYVRLSSRSGQLGGIAFQMSAANEGLLRAKEATQILKMLLSYFLKQYGFFDNDMSDNARQPKIGGYLLRKDATPDA
jgi:hypothetical protein